MKGILIFAFFSFHLELILATCSIVCPEIYKPVCAWNYTSGRLVTLQNQCVLNREQDCSEHLIEYRKSGECYYSLCADDCDPDYNDDYKCGYNKQYELYHTFGSNCEMEGWNKCSAEDMRFEILYGWFCTEDIVDTRECTEERCSEEYHPVCVFNYAFGEFWGFETHPRNCTWQRRNKCALHEYVGRSVYAYDEECNPANTIRIPEWNEVVQDFY